MIKPLCVFLCLFGVDALAVDPPITTLVVSPDGESVVAGSQAGLAVYRWPDLEYQRQISTQLANIHAAEFSPDGTLLAVAGGIPAEEGFVEIFAWPSAEKQTRLRGHHVDSVLAVAWLDDRQLVSAGLDHQLAGWDIGSAEVIRQYRGHSRGVSAVCHLPGQRILVSGGLDQNLHVWNSETTEIIRTLNNHTREIQQLAVRPGDAGLPTVASIGRDRTVRLWQPGIGRMVRFATLDSSPLGVGWSPDGSRIVVVTSDGKLSAIDPITVTITESRQAIDGIAYALAVHPGGDVLVGGSGGTLKRIAFLH